MAVPLLIKAAAKTLAKQAAKKAAAAGANKAANSGGGNGGLIAVAAIALIGLLLAPIMLVGLLITVIAGSGEQSSADCGGQMSSASALAQGEIPATALASYQRAGRTTGIDWVYLAGIGKIETSHGTYGGSTLNSDGTITPPIIGIPLNGSNNTRAIRDTDGGRWDHDTVWDRAVGPMQFIPSTWATAGKDGNNDGVNDPNNMYDAILATAYNLKANGAPGNMRAAIYAYNHSDVYVDQVMTAAESYRAAADAAGAQQAVSDTADTVTAPITTGEDKSWVLPLVDGTYQITSRYGYRGSAATGGVGTAFHEGLDFGAPSGTSIMAIADGEVTFAGPNGGYGNMVKIDHGGGISSEYGHMSRITVGLGPVSQGTVLGGVGTTGASTGNHLHLNVKVNGAYVDPETFLAGAGGGIPIVGGLCGSDLTGQYGGNTAWGGYANGRIPAEEMCALSWSPAHRLRCDAAGALEKLNVEFKAKFSIDLRVTDSYRSYDAQVTCRQNKGGLCAVPGTSNHGWGLAVDVGNGIGDFSSPTFVWMVEHAGEFGWILPPWAQQGGSKPEPWHWEYGAIS